MNKSLTLRFILVYPIAGYLGFAGLYGYLAGTPCFVNVTPQDIFQMSAYSLFLSIIIGLSYKVVSLQRALSSQGRTGGDTHEDYHQDSKVDAAWGKVADSLDSLEREHQIKDTYIANLLTLANCTSGIALWIKDNEHKYKFADDTLRNTLLSGKPQDQVLGKTDAELINAQECSAEDIVDFLNVHRPDWLPKIQPHYFAGRKVCNVTDVITKQYKVPCRFLEEIDGHVYDVWKTPLLDNETQEVVGTVGCLVDITHIKEHRAADIKRLEAEGEAFRIDSTSNFYVKKYQFGDLAHMAGQDKPTDVASPEPGTCQAASLM